MDGLKRAMELLPPAYRQALAGWDGSQIEELRLRVNRAPTVLLAGREQPLIAGKVDEEALLRILERATGASLHAAASAMAEGYLSYRGLRLGVCGTAVMREGVQTGFQHYSSLAIRIPRECRGICDGAIRELYGEGYCNTLILAPPGGGKTTALRELIRRLSEGGARIGVVDERNELAATEQGSPQFDLGPCSDVLTGSPKAEGAMLLLRAMNPQLIAMDEITRERDAEALCQCYGCGVGILASAHGRDAADLERRTVYRRLLEKGIFRALLLIRQEGGERRYRVERL